jgi:tetratricopeptide (TPR) repeat protein
MADEFDREGKAQAAASHYNSFLDQIARQPAQDRPAPDKVIAIVLRMADCQVHSSQTELAMKSYHLAEKLASQTSQIKLESVADVNDAALQSKAGKLDEALRLYQQALRLDDSTADTSASAQDWYAYGRFLDDAGFPARLAFACMVKSESLMRSLPSPAVPASLVAERQKIENRLGTTAAVVRRDPDPALQEALALRR